MRPDRTRSATSAVVEGVTMATPAEAGGDEGKGARSRRGGDQGQSQGAEAEAADDHGFAAQRSESHPGDGFGSMVVASLRAHHQCDLGVVQAQAPAIGREKTQKRPIPRKARFQAGAMITPGWTKLRLIPPPKPRTLSPSEAFPAGPGSIRRRRISSKGQQAQDAHGQVSGV